MSPSKSYRFTVDGVAVGDRLLEDIEFDVFMDLNADTGDYVVTNIVAPNKYEAYLGTLNMDYWLGKVKEYAEDIIREDLLNHFEVTEL